MQISGITRRCDFIVYRVFLLLVLYKLFYFGTLVLTFYFVVSFGLGSEFRTDLKMIQ